jgi:hypothetical protein
MSRFEGARRLLLLDRWEWRQQDSDQFVEQIEIQRLLQHSNGLVPRSQSGTDPRR